MNEPNGNPTFIDSALAVTEPAAPVQSSPIDSAADSFIAQMAQEFADQNLNSEIEGTQTEQTEAPVTQEAKTEAPVEPKETKTEDPTERGLERLVAREVEIRSREEKVLHAEKENETLRTRLRELEARQVPQDLLNTFELSPLTGLRNLGLDPDVVIKKAIAEKLGDKAPEPLLNDIRAAQTQAKIRALEEQLLNSQRAQAAAQFYDRVAQGARAYVTQGVAEHAPTLADVAKTAPDRVYSEIMEEIAKDAQTRAAREPNGEVLPYSEAAKRVEARWADMRKLLTGGQNPVDTNAGMTPTTTSTVAPKSTPPNATVTKPITTTPTPKPPDKPLAPWQRTNSLEEEGLKAALLEYRRVEQAERK